MLEANDANESNSASGEAPTPFIGAVSMASNWSLSVARSMAQV